MNDFEATLYALEHELATRARRVTRQARWRRAHQSVLAQSHLAAEPAAIWNSLRAVCRHIRHLERAGPPFGSEVWIDNLRTIACAEIIAWKRAREAWPRDEVDDALDAFPTIRQARRHLKLRREARP